MKTQEIASKVRTGFIIQWVVVNISILAVLTFLFIFSLTEGHIDPARIELWLTVIGGSIYLFSIFFYPTSTLKRILLTETGITVKNRFTGRTLEILFSEIIQTKTRMTNTGSSRDAPLTDGFEVLEIHYSRDRIFALDENEYSNYREIKSALYQQLKNRPAI